MRRKDDLERLAGRRSNRCTWRHLRSAPGTPASPARSTVKAKPVASNVPVGASGPIGTGVCGRRTGAGPVEEPVDIDVAGRDGLVRLAGHRHEVMDGRPDVDGRHRRVRGVMDRGRRRGREQLDERQRRGRRGRRVRVAVGVAGPSRVVAEVVPGQECVVLELVIRQREVTGLDRVVGERLDEDNAVERDRATRDAQIRVADCAGAGGRGAGRATGDIDPHGTDDVA